MKNLRKMIHSNKLNNDKGQADQNSNNQTF